MKALVTALVVTTALLAGTATAELGAVVNSFPAPPNSYPMALARSREALYAYCKLDAGPARALIYRFDPKTGSVENTFGLPWPPYTNYSGLAYTADGSLWIANGTIDLLFRLDAETGYVKKSFGLYGEDIRGLAPRQNTATGGAILGIWARNSRPKAVTLYDHRTGSIKERWLWNPGGADIGWLYGKKVLFAGLTEGSGYFVQAFKSTGSMVATFPAPAPAPVYGCTYYEGYLWVSASRTETSYEAYIWKLDVRDLIGITPTSIGRVKALFR
jgi:hypothetical protein